MLKQAIALIFFVLFSASDQTQQIKFLTYGKPVSLRGLSAVNDRIIWVSGSGGNVGLTTDGGTNWKWIQVPHYEKSDFRDIEAFSDQEAILMGITEPAVILRTTDGGSTWMRVFEDSSKSVFLDAMDFSGNLAAVVGDPVGDNIFYAESQDRGRTWKKISSSGFAATAAGETFFAASGSNIHRTNDGSWTLVSGGKKSCLYYAKFRFPLLMNQGEETTGANSIAINPSAPNEAYIVGGDFSHDTLRYRNSIKIQLQPFVQTPPLTPPHGYRSCVEYLDEKRMICCGSSGVDISTDGGMNWNLISNKSFHVCHMAKTGNTIFLAGTHGAVAMLVPVNN